MSSASSRPFAIVAVLLAGALAVVVWPVLVRGRAATAPQAAADRDGGGADRLRVCADPNNLPFSNERREGFENALADIVARELGRRVEYTWWPQRRGFIRTTLRAGVCDVVMGVPAEFELADTTRPYYRSTYVAVARRDRGLRITSMDDPRLRTVSIGIHLVGDDYASVPPGTALGARGIVQNVRGYSIYGDYSKPNPPADLIAAVTRGDVDVAIAWGPLAGYVASVSDVPLTVDPIAAPDDVPFEFSIAMGVRRGDHELRQRLDEVLQRRRGEVEALLERYHVPRVAMADGARTRPEVW